MWRVAQEADLPLIKFSKPEGVGLVVNDSDKARLCPACEHLMLPYIVGYDTKVSLNRCVTCGSFWLDANEWEILKSRHMNDRLHFVASDAWQADVARQEREKGHEQIVLEKIGAEDLEKIKSIKVWIESHPRKAELYAVLLDKKER